MKKEFRSRSRIFREYRIPADMVCKTVTLDAPHIEFMETPAGAHCVFFRQIGESCEIEVIERLYIRKTDSLANENLKISRQSQAAILQFLKEEEECPRVSCYLLSKRLDEGGQR